MTRARIPGLICVLVLLGILVAGLAPFERPRNAVTWLGNQNGVRFGRYGTIWSAGEFIMADAQGEASCSLKIWLQPDTASASSTLLAFYTPHAPLQFLLQQYHGLLILSRQIVGDQNRTQIIGTDGVFRRLEPVFITITSGAEQSAMYVDGNLRDRSPGFELASNARANWCSVPHRSARLAGPVS